MGFILLGSGTLGNPIKLIAIALFMANGVNMTQYNASMEFRASRGYGGL